MCLLFLVGITGIYARQVDKAGWLGLAGFLLLSVSWALLTAFVFAEAFILPPLATRRRSLWMASWGSPMGTPASVNLGALPTIYSLGVGVTLYARRPAVWHRDVPRRHPAALGGRSACRRGHADPPGGAAPARAYSGSRRCRWA